MVTRLMVLLAAPDAKLLDELGRHSPVPHLESPVQKQSCAATGLPQSSLEIQRWKRWPCSPLSHSGPSVQK